VRPLVCAGRKEVQKCKITKKGRQIFWSPRPLSIKFLNTPLLAGAPSLNCALMGSCPSCPPLDPPLLPTSNFSREPKNRPHCITSLPRSNVNPAIARGANYRGLSRSVTCGGGAPPHGSRRRRRAAALTSAAAASEFFRRRRRGV
jgi:hypothetical protein